MKAFKRIVAMILSLTLLTCFAGFVCTAATETKPTKISGLKITTDGKKNYLKLSWDKQTNADGYQVFRSTSGDRRTYQRIAVVRKAAYADRELKSATAYYYAVRAFMKQKGKTVFGAFAKADLSTRITKAYAEKLSRKVYQVAYDWLHQYWFEWADRKNETPITVRYTGSPELSWVYGKNARFYRLNHPKIKTMKQLKAFLQKTFSKETVDDITTHYYKEKDGILYRITSISGDELAVLYPSKNKVKFSKITDKRIDMILYVTSSTYDYDRERSVSKVVPQKESLYYQNGRWVFGKNRDGLSWEYGMWFLNGDERF